MPDPKSREKFSGVQRSSVSTMTFSYDLAWRVRRYVSEPGPAFEGPMRIEH